MRTAGSSTRRTATNTPSVHIKPFPKRFYALGDDDYMPRRRQTSWELELQSSASYWCLYNIIIQSESHASFPLDHDRSFHLDRNTNGTSNPSSKVMSTKNLDNDPTIMQKLNKQNHRVCHPDRSHSDTQHSLSSSSSSSAGGRADGISWISRRVWSVDCSVPSWWCCWSTQAGVKPPSSWDGLEGVEDAAAADE